MPYQNKLLLTLCATLFAMPAWAGDAAPPSAVTASMTFASDYVFRGISRTNSLPAVQGAVDITATNGFYIGAWGSNSSWLSDRGLATTSSLELDAYAGVKTNLISDLNLDLGTVRYHYPAAYVPGTVNVDTSEAYLGMTYQVLGIKYSYSVGNAFGIAQSKGTNYLDVSLNYVATDVPVILGAHYGKQKYRGPVAEAMKLGGMDPSYVDYKISLGYNLNGFIIGAAYSKTAKASNYYASPRVGSLARSVTVFSLSKTY